MPSRQYFPPRQVVLGLLALSLASCAEVPPPLTPLPDASLAANTEPLPPEVEQQLWRVEGAQIVDGSGEPVLLRGIAFGNQVWDHVEIPSAHHTGRDFENVAAMGMNSVRFYLSYRTFEDDSEPYVYQEAGWAWLDQNVQWAKRYGVRLVLNMHAPVGGYQSQGKGAALWQQDEAQRRFVALWRAIAERYREEPTIAGFDILNEPVPTESIEQWKSLAENTIEQIRQVNQHHMIFVERVNAVGGDWSENAQRNFFRVSDPNVVYEFHFYKPYHFTHQNASWSEFAAREAWYPDDSIPEADWFQLKTEAVAQSDPLPPGDSDWTMLETEPFTVENPKIKLGKPFLVCDNAGDGEATFDSLSLTRVAAAAPELPQRKLETMFERDLDTRRGWYFWTQNGAGRATTSAQGHGDTTALSIAGTTGPANLGADPLRFWVETGAEYQLQALVKAQGLNPASRCHLRLEFYSSERPLYGRNQDYLKSELQAYLAWGKKEEVPLYLGEFGTIRDSFLPGRGGVKWVSDMLDLLLSEQVSFAYHTYHEDPFGLFSGDGTLPSQERLNQPLFDVFVEKLKGAQP